MFELKTAALDVALEKFLDTGRAKAYSALKRAGTAVAKDAQKQGSQLHGPLHVRPKVKTPSGDVVTVGYANVRPQTRAKAAKMLQNAKGRHWPKAIR